MKTRLKETLLEECNLHTIVRLPNGVFNPYTGIKTNLLFFTKGQPTKHIWYYEHPYPDGVKSYNKTKPMRFEEFQPEIDWWGNEADGFEARVETEQAWKVSIDEIIARNYNLDIKNPHVGEQISHDPDELLQKYASNSRKSRNCGINSKTFWPRRLMVGDKRRNGKPHNRPSRYLDISANTKNQRRRSRQWFCQAKPAWHQEAARADFGTGCAG